MKRALIIALVLAGMGLLLSGWIMFGDHSSFRTGLSQYEGLPSGASDITVYQNKNLSGIFAAEFKISESDFDTFAAQRYWVVQPISGSVVVYQPSDFHEGRPSATKEIHDGLYYSQRDGNGGGTAVAYDRKDGRAYITISSR